MRLRHNGRGRVGRERCANVLQRRERAAVSDLCFVLGTSAIVYPAAGLPVAAQRGGAFLVEVNPEETPLSEICDVTLRGAAGEILPLREL